MVITIYPMDIDGDSGGPYWLHWLDSELGEGAVEVDVARGPILGDTTERTYITGLDAPRVTNLEYATDEDHNPGVTIGSYPYETYLLGVPAPDEEPTLEVIVEVPTEGQITLVNPGAETGNTTGWTIVTGTLLSQSQADVPSLVPAEGTRFFAGGSAATTEAYQVIDLETAGIIAGSNFALLWAQASGSNASEAQMGVRFYDDANVFISEEFAALEDVTPTFLFADRSLQATIPDGAVTARLVQKFVKVGGGDNDAYIDAIQFNVTSLSNYYDGSDLSPWTVQVEDSNSSVGVSMSQGWPLPSYRFMSRRDSVASIRRDFGVSSIPQITLEFEFQRIGVSNIDFRAVIGANAAGAGPAFSFSPSGIRQTQESVWVPTGNMGPITNVLTTDDYVSDGRFKATFVLRRNFENAYTVSIDVVQMPSEVEVYSGTASVVLEGDFIGFKGQHFGNTSCTGYLDNITIKGSALDGEDSETVATNYVFTWVNQFGEESAPSPVSLTIQKLADSSVIVTTPTDPPAGYGIVSKRIYRAVTGETTTEYQFVAEIPVAQDEYTDTKADSELGEILESYDYDLPPEDGRGILATANGITYLFAGNQLCPSVLNRPHAYPVPYRLATDFPIVAIAALDTDIIVATQANPYIVQGPDPSALTMQKIEKPQGCVSKRSMLGLDGIGIMFACPDGIAVVNRSGVEVITKGLFTRDQWQELKPETIHAAAHDGRYFFWYDKGGEDGKGGYILDPTQGGFGLVRLNFWCSAAHSNPINDKLYMAIDDILTIWDEGEEKTPYRWRSKEYPLVRSTAFRACCIRAEDYDDLTLRLYADRSDTPYFERAITSGQEFLLPVIRAERYFEFELEGTSRVQRIEIAESMEELT